MKPILLTGTAAYSPFRLDALRAALGACAPELKTAQIDARWVYAIQPEGAGPDEETLARAALLLNADADNLTQRHGDTEKSGQPRASVPLCDSDGKFFVTPRKGTISP